MPSSEGTSALTGPSVGEGESGLGGAEERGGPPRPRPVLGPRGRQHPAPRGKAAARAHWRPLPAPSSAPEAPPSSSRAASARRADASGFALPCPPAPPAHQPPPQAWPGGRGGHVGLGGKSGRARRDPAGRRLGLRSTPRPRPSPIRLPLWTGAGGQEKGRREPGSRDHPFLRSHAGFLDATSVPGCCVLGPEVPPCVPGAAVRIGGEVPAPVELTA